MAGYRTTYERPPQSWVRQSPLSVLYRVRTGVAWRDLPERFGPWNTIAQRFCRWVLAGQ